MTLPFKTDHVAFVTGDTKQTVDFYTRVMEWPLVGAFGGTEPDGRPFLITVFQGDGWVLEFEEVEGRSGPSPQAAGFPHFGLDVGSHDEYERWKSHLAACGVGYLETREHNCWITDPNGVSFQLIVKEPDSRAPEQRKADGQKLVEEWIS
jgi:catechol 2,3-dioxygenase-like lactoylglutathione lyase family enzyme